jgi:hypothetical protein
MKTGTLAVRERSRDRIKVMSIKAQRTEAFIKKRLCSLSDSKYDLKHGFVSLDSTLSIA